MNATPPLSLADLLTSAAANGAAASPAQAASVVAELLLAETTDAADARGAATFAALLQSAGLAADPAKPTDGQPEHAREPTADVVATIAETQASVFDTLLFLANVQPTVAAQIMPAVPVRASQPSGVAPAGRAIDEQVAAIPAAPTSSAPLATLDADTAADIPPALLPRDAHAAESPRTTPDGGRESTFNVPRALPAADVAAAAASASAPLVRAPQRESGTHDTARIATVSTSEPSALVAQPANPVHASPLVAIDIETPVGDPGWRVETAERLVSLVTRGVERAELRLSPAELGPVEVRIDVRGGEATLAIVAAQPATRDALEQALPALRDMLAQQGLSLGEATVRDGRADGQANSRDPQSQAPAFDAAARGDEPTTAPVARVVRRLVDTFA